MGAISQKNGHGAALKKQPGESARAGAAKHPAKLNPALKSWLDNVIIPALVREYLAEIKNRNQLAIAGASEVTSDKDGNQP